MSAPKTLLVPTDFGLPAESALAYAVELAAKLGAEIVLLHVYQLPIVPFPEAAVVATAELARHVVAGAEVGLDRASSSVMAAGVGVRGIVRQGDPARITIEVAAEVNADLIVIGTHGRTGLPRALIGSVAEKVVRMSAVPVLSVHAT